MKKIISMGEALIDFIPAQKGCDLKDVQSFTKACGGAPCNVAAAVSKLGGKSMMITQLGDDAFGDFIEETIAQAGVDTSAVFRTSKANTALAFVSLKADGDRDFSFYRRPSADMLLESDSINDKWFDDTGIFHFCSVALVPSPMRDAHEKALSIAKSKNVLVSFDPNIRFPLWEDKMLLKSTILEFMDYADITKISDEEIEFITGYSKVEQGVKWLFEQYPNLKAVLYSMGKNGAKLITRDYEISAKDYTVNAVDTTGAGDCIIGSFLYMLAKNNIDAHNFDDCEKELLQSALDFANCCSSISVTRYGAIASYANIDEVNKFSF